MSHDPTDPQSGGFWSDFWRFGIEAIGLVLTTIGGYYFGFKKHDNDGERKAKALQDESASSRSVARRKDDAEREKRETKTWKDAYAMAAEASNQMVEELKQQLKDDRVECAARLAQQDLRAQRQEMLIGEQQKVMHLYQQEIADCRERDARNKVTNRFLYAAYLSNRAEMKAKGWQLGPPLEMPDFEEGKVSMNDFHSRTVSDEVVTTRQADKLEDQTNGKSGDH